MLGVEGRESNRSSDSSVHSLKAATGDALDNMERDHLVKACARFRFLREAVISAQGS